MINDTTVGYDRDALKNDLKEWVVTVFFEKKDGSLRKMKCTLSPNHLPTLEESERKKAENQNTLSVWDLDNSGWRSFRLDSIKSVRYDSVV